jgi:hypothetical protein
MTERKGWTDIGAMSPGRPLRHESGMTAFFGDTLQGSRDPGMDVATHFFTGRRGKQARIPREYASQPVS